MLDADRPHGVLHFDNVLRQRHSQLSLLSRWHQHRQTLPRSNRQQDLVKTPHPRRRMRIEPWLQQHQRLHTARSVDHTLEALVLAPSRHLLQTHHVLTHRSTSRAIAQTTLALPRWQCRVLVHREHVEPVVRSSLARSHSALRVLCLGHPSASPTRCPNSSLQTHLRHRAI